jgi:hypothetical protein
VEGSVFTLSIEENGIESRATPYRNYGRAIRGRIRHFSRSSRRNLLRRLASINRSAFRAFKGRLIPITLTYPHKYPEDPEVCKNPLKALPQRLEKECGDFVGFWRSSIQRRGTFHVHVLLFVSLPSRSRGFGLDEIAWPRDEVSARSVLSGVNACGIRQEEALCTLPTCCDQTRLSRES